MPDVEKEFADKLRAMDPIALVARADEIKKLLLGMNPNEAPEEKQIPLLHELSCIAGIMRGRSLTADPKKKKSTTTKRITVSLDSIL